MVRPTGSFNTSARAPAAGSARHDGVPPVQAATEAHRATASSTQSSRPPSPHATVARHRLAVAYAARRDEFKWSDLLTRCAEAPTPSNLMVLVRNAPAGINDRDSDGKTLVEAILKHGGPAMAQTVTALRAQGADLISADEDGNTLLHRMVMAQNVSAIDLLLRNDVDVNAFNRYTRSTIARYAKDPRAVYESMSKPNWYWGEDDTATPVHLAAAFGNPAVIRTLVKHGANITHQNKDRLTPLHWAMIFSDNAHVASALLAAGARVNVDVLSRCTPLQITALCGTNEDMIHFLIDHGAEIDATDETGCTALHRAAMNPENPKIMAALIARGANLDAIDHTGSSAVDVSLYVLRPQSRLMLAQLKDAGADMEQRDMNGNTILHRVVMYGDEAAVRALLSVGVDVNTFNRCTDTTIAQYAADPAATAAAMTHPYLTWDQTGNATALHLTAAIGVKPAIARALVGHGADIHLRNDAGCAPIDWAALRSLHPPMVDTLIELGADPNPHREDQLQPLHEAATFSGHVGIAAALIRGGAQINAVSMEGATPLLYAALPHGYPEMVRTLLQLGANPNHLGINNFSPLHAAAISPHVDKVRALIEAGADVNAKDAAGRTPLYFAQTGNSEQTDVAQLLIAHGALSLPDCSNDETPSGSAPTSQNHQGETDIDLDRRFAMALHDALDLQQLEAQLVALALEQSSAMQSRPNTPDPARGVVDAAIASTTVIDVTSQHQLAELRRLSSNPLVRHVERWFGETSRSAQLSRATAWHAINDEPHAGEFQDFLAHLHETAEFRYPQQRPDYIRRVAQVLSAIQNSPELRQHCFLLVEDATSSCGDRVGLTLNNLDMARIEHEAEHGLHSAQDLINIRTSQFRIQILGEIAQRKIATLRPVLGDRLDEIEVIHGAITLVAEELNLIGVSRTMLYGAYAHFSDADKRAALALIAQRESRGEYIKFIAEWPPWQKQLRRLRPADFNDLDQRVTTERDTLSEQPDYTSDNDYIELCRRMEDMQNTRLAFSLENWTREWLVQHRRSSQGSM